MSNAVLPAFAGFAWGRGKTPLWSTRIKTAASQAEARATYTTYPLWRFAIPVEFLRDRPAQQELAQLAGFYNARQGSFDSFLFDCREDRAIVDQAFGVGNAVASSFRLVRTYGGFTEPVMNPNAITNIKINGSITAAYTLGAKGLVTFTSPPVSGAALTWSGSYYYRVRFNADDDMNFEQITGGQHWKLAHITLLGSLGDKV